MKNLIKTAILSTAAVLAGWQSASAELVVSNFTYRVGPFENSAVPYSDGFADYFTLLNERDGGINGQYITVFECEYGYNVPKGIECFDEAVEKGALSILPQQTALTFELIPRATELGIPIHTMGYALAAAADGETFRYVFNFPAHFWQGAYAQIAHLKEISGGSLEGKTIAHIHLNNAYGYEPIPTLEALAEQEGFRLVMVPIDVPGTDQTAAWDAMMAENPDYALLWGWGAMNEVAIGEAIDHGFPVDHIIGIWWSSNEDDVRWYRDDADGYRAVTFHAMGTSFSIYNDMNMMVYQTGKARGQMNNIGDVLYNRGVIQAVFVELAIRKAMEIHGTTEITPEMMRDGYENLEITEELLAERGLEGFMPEFKTSCTDHVGDGLVAVGQWSARHQRWLQITDFAETDNAMFQQPIKDAAAAFAEANGITPGSCD